MTTGSTAELVDNVLKAMRDAAATGDPAAVATLEEKVTPEGRAKPGTGPRTPAGPPPLPTGLAGSEGTILRPNGEAYHVRKLGVHEDVAVLRKARVKAKPAMAYGPPGTGKTALIEAAFAPAVKAGEERAPEDQVFTVQGSADTDVADFVGGYIPLPGGDFEWIDGPLVLAMEAGAVLYIDEIALIDPKVMAIVYGVMDGRGELRITQNPAKGVVKSQPGFYIVSACNPNAPGARMSEALLSRFVLQFEVTTDYGLARKLGVNSKVVTAALNLAKKVTSGESSWAPQLRELLAFRDLEIDFGTPFALNNLVSQSPEMDRPVVADVLTRTLGQPVGELKLT